jgi:hypothetical protein
LTRCVVATGLPTAGRRLGRRAGLDASRWAQAVGHFTFTRMNIEPTIPRNQIEEDPDILKAAIFSGHY